jgi:ribonuclease T2
LIIVLAVLGIGLALKIGQNGPVPKDMPDKHAAMPAAAFDFYLMAMTWHAAFCADGHGREQECLAPAPRPLVIHGLWPERLEPRTYPHDCKAPRLKLDKTLTDSLREYMPGMAVNLHEHEWREHGSCSGLDADVYFTQAYLLARDLESALAPTLTTRAGGEIGAAQLRAAADAATPGLGATFTLHCRTLRDAPPALRNRPFLVEIRQCVKIEAPGTDRGEAFDCATVNRHDQGCGRSFRIAKIAP